MNDLPSRQLLANFLNSNPGLDTTRPNRTDFDLLADKSPSSIENPAESAFEDYDRSRESHLNSLKADHAAFMRKQGDIVLPDRNNSTGWMPPLKPSQQLWRAKGATAVPLKAPKMSPNRSHVTQSTGQPSISLLSDESAYESQRADFQSGATRDSPIVPSSSSSLPDIQKSEGRPIRGQCTSFPPAEVGSYTKKQGSAGQFQLMPVDRASRMTSHIVSASEKYPSKQNPRI